MCDYVYGGKVIREPRMLVLLPGSPHTCLRGVLGIMSQE